MFPRLGLTVIKTWQWNWIVKEVWNYLPTYLTVQKIRLVYKVVRGALSAHRRVSRVFDVRGLRGPEPLRVPSDVLSYTVALVHTQETIGSIGSGVSYSQTMLCQHKET